MGTKLTGSSRRPELSPQEAKVAHCLLGWKGMALSPKGIMRGTAIPLKELKTVIDGMIEKGFLARKRDSGGQDLYFVKGCENGS